jgi:hypothetical protein
MSTEDSMCFDIFPALWATSRSPNSSIQCRSACLTTSRCESSTSWRHMNSFTSTMQSGYPCLLTTTLHHKVSHMRKFPNCYRGNNTSWQYTSWLVYVLRCVRP